MSAPRIVEPTEDAISIAVAWLHANEGEGGEKEACAAVADWISAVTFENELRRTARANGVPVARLRRAMAAKAAGAHPA